jgi:hypothetical protein
VLAFVLGLAVAVQGAPPPETLLPPPPVRSAGADKAYAARVGAMLPADAWPWPQLEAARPTTPAQALALAELVRDADDRGLRLLATLAAGCDGGGPLAHALWTRTTGVLPEAAALACLLAPARAPEEWWPALAHLAARTTVPLPVRAAAIARLLESGCDAAWPWARAVLLTGTARDLEAEPFADWQRGGRYELPKRILVAALDARAQAHGEEACGFDPNAAWAEQERAVARIAARFAQVAAVPSAPLPESWRAALALAAAGEDRAARRALALLGAARPALLRGALASGDPDLALAARRALDEAPR